VPCERRSTHLNEIRGTRLRPGRGALAALLLNPTRRARPAVVTRLVPLPNRVTTPPLAIRVRLAQFHPLSRKTPRFGHGGAVGVPLVKLQPVAKRAT